MNKSDLTDVTFLITIRVDSQERIDNLNLILNFLTSNFKTTIKVLEADKKVNITNELIDYKIFVIDNTPVFHRTKYINELTQSATTPIIAIWDTDVLMRHEQIIEGVTRIRMNKNHFVIPYNGCCYFVEKILSEKFRKYKDFEILEKNISKHHLYQSHAVGGAFIANRKTYYEIGMENENFHGWGPEDLERIKRWEILGYDFDWIGGSAYHMFHPRGINSSFYSEQNKVQFKKEYLKVCKMDYNQLRNYVRSWNHMNKNIGI